MRGETAKRARETSGEECQRGETRQTPNEWPLRNEHRTDLQRGRITTLDKEGYLSLLLREPCVTAVQCERPGGVCRSTNVFSVERQTRSSDEPVTIFHTCRTCSYTWADMG